LSGWVIVVGLGLSLGGALLLIMMVGVELLTPGTAFGWITYVGPLAAVVMGGLMVLVSAGRRSR
jgi:hypothetical protein